MKLSIAHICANNTTPAVSVVPSGISSTKVEYNGQNCTLEVVAGDPCGDHRVGQGGKDDLVN